MFTESTLVRFGSLVPLAGLCWVLGCASGQATPLGPVPSEVTVDLQETRYPISGSTEEELRLQMDALGPGSGWYQHRWNIRWRYSYDEVEEASIISGASSETVCEITDIQLTLIFTKTLPEWDPPADASEDLVRNWEGFSLALQTHGEGHRDIVVEATREIIRRLKDLETPNCAFMQREARRLVDDILERSRERDREYDRETERGRTQGVVWPFRGGLDPTESGQIQ